MAVPDGVLMTLESMSSATPRGLFGSIGLMAADS